MFWLYSYTIITERINLCLLKLQRFVFLTQYCAGDKIEKMRWAGHVARMDEERGVYRFLVGKPEGKRPLGRPRRR